MARFAKGVSGNPRGRSRGSSRTAALQKAMTGTEPTIAATIAQAMPAVVAAVIKKAVAGDPTSAKMLLDRTHPAPKPSDAPIRFPCMFPS
jgi:hypothetical protein